MVSPHFRWICGSLHSLSFFTSMPQSMYLQCVADFADAANIAAANSGDYCGKSIVFELKLIRKVILFTHHSC